MKAVATLISMTFIIVGAAILLGAASNPILAADGIHYETCFQRP